MDALIGKTIASISVVNGFWWIEFTDGTVATIEATALMDILPSQKEAA